MILHKPKPHTPLFVSFIDRIYQTNKQDSLLLCFRSNKGTQPFCYKTSYQDSQFSQKLRQCECLSSNCSKVFFFFVFFLSHKVGSNFKLSREFGFLKEEWIVVRGFGFL